MDDAVRLARPSSAQQLSCSTELRALAMVALSATPWTPMRKQLVAVLLEDWQCQLSAAHAEVLLRWRLDTQDSAPCQDRGLLQPAVLRACLAEDQQAPKPVVTALGPAAALDSLLSGTPTAPGSLPTSGRLSPATAWQQCALQLDLHSVAAQLGLHTASCSPSPADHHDTAELPAILYEFEAPLVQVGAGTDAPASVVTPAVREHTQSPFSGSVHHDQQGENHTAASHLHTTPRRDRPNTGQGALLYPTSLKLLPNTTEVPEAVATCWPAGMTSSLQRLSASSPGLSSAENSGQLPRGRWLPSSRPTVTAIAEQVAATQHQQHAATSQQQPAAARRPAASLLSQGGLRAAMAEWGSQASASGTIATPSITTTSVAHHNHATLPQPGSYLHAGLSSSFAPLPAQAVVMPSVSERYAGTDRVPWGYGLVEYANTPAAFDSTLLGTSLNLPGSLPAGSFVGSFQVGGPSRMTQSLPGLLQQAAALRPSASQSGGQVPMQDPAHGSVRPSLLGGAHGLLGGTGGPAQGVAQLVTQHGPIKSTSLGFGAAREPIGIPRSLAAQQTQLAISAEDFGTPIVGTMDLDTALEAIINYESGLDKGRDKAAVSHATAAAAHTSLKQHAEAAVRAAAQQESSLSGHPGALHASFAAFAKLAGDSPTSGTPSAVTSSPAAALAASAPAASVAVLRQSTTDAQAAFMAGTGLAHAGVGAEHAAAGASGSGQLAASHPATGNGPVVLPPPVSFSAPRPTAGWASTTAKFPGGTSRLSASGSRSADMDASSIAAAAVAAAKTAAAVAHQQQQAATAAALLGAQPPPLKGSGLSKPHSLARLSTSSASDGNSGSPTPSRSLWSKLTRKLKAEVQQMLIHVPNVKAEDLEDAVLYQLIAANRGDSEEARQELAQLQQLMTQDGSPASQPSAPAPPASLVRASIAQASKAALLKLPSKVLHRLDEVVARSAFIEWKHFDAGVVKVLAQLTELNEPDILEELQTLEGTDLSNVEYMPAYLNKRLNNRLWSRRKATQP